jgi:hypothetical protein
MRWEDERYVRIYTRDTPDWLALGWEAQALFVFATRKCDRAGILELGRSGTRGLAALVAMPLEVVERALPILLSDGCVQMNGTTLVIPNFIEAQETPQSDAQRQRESRARARDRAASQNVTEESRNVTSVTDSVTPGHAASHAVTPNCAVPSRAVPCSSALGENATPPPRDRKAGLVSASEQMTRPFAVQLHSLLAETWPDLGYAPGKPAMDLDRACQERGGTAAFAVSCREFAQRKGVEPGSTAWFASCLKDIGKPKTEPPRGRKAMGIVGSNWEESGF